MDIRNMEGLPESVRRGLGSLLNDLIGEYGESIISVIVYGSVTGPEYDPKTSDVNVAVVLNDVSLAKLKPALGIVKKGLKKGITVPLFLTPAYIRMSLDTFPMEFIEMKDSRCVLLGEDVLADIEVKKEDLRRECEYQLKGKLLTIRQAYLEQALTRRGLEGLIKASFRALVPVFRNVLRVKGVRPQQIKEQMLQQVEEEFNVDVSSFLEVLRDKKTDGHIGENPAETFLNDFLLQLEHISHVIDEL